MGDDALTVQQIGRGALRMPRDRRAIRGAPVSTTVLVEDLFEFGMIDRSSPAGGHATRDAEESSSLGAGAAAATLRARTRRPLCRTLRRARTFQRGPQTQALT